MFTKWLHSYKKRIEQLEIENKLLKEAVAQEVQEKYAAYKRIKELNDKLNG